MRDVNIDANTVGWYQSTYLGGFLDDKLIDSMFMYQESISKSVVLVFDPLQDSVGKCGFKAYRLKQEFFKRKMSEQRGEALHLDGLTSDGVFEEVPIQVHNPCLVEAYLCEWATGDASSTTVAFESLDMENQTFMERNVQFLLECLDDLAAEQQKLQYCERNLVRQQQQQKRLAEERRLQNQERGARGEDLLADDSPAFKRAPAPSQLET